MPPTQCATSARLRCSRDGLTAAMTGMTDPKRLSRRAAGSSSLFAVEQHELRSDDRGVDDPGNRPKNRKRGRLK